MNNIPYVYVRYIYEWGNAYGSTFVIIIWFRIIRCMFFSNSITLWTLFEHLAILHMCISTYLMG